MKLGAWLESLVRDAGLGLRMLRKSAAVTSASVASLALAIGACLAAFSLVDALILRPLPVREPDRLIYLTYPSGNPERPETETFSDPLFVRLRDAARGRVDLFAMSDQVAGRARFGGDDSERVRTQFVSGDAFDQLGILPAAGRLLASHDDVAPGRHAVAVVSHAYWIRRFGGNRTILGSWFALDDQPFQIVGVAEPRFTGVEPGRPTDVWLPYSMYNARAFGNPDRTWFRIVGRLNDRVPGEQAHPVLQASFTNFRRDRVPYLEPGRSADSVARYVQTPIHVRSAANGPSPLRRQFARPLWILASIAALVLLVAGSNVANLFLARMAAREREMALRLSLGAGRTRLIQQVFVESALVAAAACVLGLVVAWMAAPIVVAMLGSADDPVYLELRVNWRLVGFAGALALLATALFGAVPALRASGVAPITALKSGDARTGARTRTLRSFVALQVAFGLVVLFVGGLLLRSFARLSSVNPGFVSANVLVVSLEPARRVDANEPRAELLRVLERLRRVPGVEAVGSARFNVLGRPWTHSIRIPGAPRDTVDATMAPVTPGFLETMQIPLLAGRAFVSVTSNRNTQPQS